MRIEDILHLHHYIEIGVIEDEVHEFLLLNAYAVFTAQRSTGGDANLHDVAPHIQDLIHLVLSPAVEKDERMQVAVTRVEHVRDHKAISIRNAIDFREHAGQLGPRYDRIHDDHIRTDAAHRAECAFAAEPQLSAFLIVLCDAYFVGLVLATNLYDRVGSL